MKSHLITSYVLLLLLALCYSVSCRLSIFSNSFDDVTSDSEDIVTCIESHSTNISQHIFTPVNSSFLPTWQAGVNNGRFNKSETPKPSIIVTPVDESQVRTALLCTKKHGYEIRIRSGGHDFEGLSYTADVPFLMIDFINLRSIDIDVAKRTAWVQSGAGLGEVYYSISQKTNTLYFPAGVWPTVGVGGHVGGGGYGNLLRKYGLAADNVLDIRFMDVNGRILTKKTMGELFWAVRGAGASNFGIAISWKLRLVPVPEIVTSFTVDKTLEEGATEIFYKYQTVMPNIDRNLNMYVQWNPTYVGNTTQKTIRMGFAGVYQGTVDTLIPMLKKNFPELNVTREMCEEVKMVQTSLLFAGFPTSTPTEILINRSAITTLSFKGKSDYMRAPISIDGLKKIWAKIFENDGSDVYIVAPFGGRMSEISETAIPYPHRAGVLYQLQKRISFSDQASDTTPTSLARIEWLKSFDAFLAPYVTSNPREAYFNYNDLDLGVGNETYEEASAWGERYFKRANFKKLIRIKARVDPDNFFRHPQSIPVFSTRLSDI